MGSVAKRIIAGFTIVVLTLSAIIVLLLVRIYQFNSRYESILQNVLNLNNIKTVSSMATANINNACIMQMNVEESGMLAEIEEMFGYLDELEASIGDGEAYQGNRSMVNSLRQSLEKYKAGMESIVAMGDGTSFPPVSGELNKSIISFQAIGLEMSSYCNNNITMELERSAAIQKEIESNFRQTIYFALTAFAAVLLTGAGICAWIVRGITRPIKVLKKELTLIADGDLTKEEIRLPARNEFSGLAAAFNAMSGSLKDIIGTMAGVTADIADTAAVADRTSYDNIKHSLEITQSTGDISRRMHEQSEEIGKIMGQMQEMKEISMQISENMEEIDFRTKGAKENAEKGNGSIEAFVEQLRQVNHTVSQIAGAAESFGENTRKVNEILKGISGISQQTRLLSLNASIEAARAGDAGRGFTVVAEEINTLAERTVELVNAISGIVSQLEKSMEELTSKMELGLSQLERGNGMVAETQDKFADILTDSARMNEEIRDVNRKMEVFARNVTDISDRMVDVNQMTEENVKATDRIVITAENQSVTQKQLNDKVLALDGLVNRLKGTTSKFKISGAEVNASSASGIASE